MRLNNRWIVLILIVIIAATLRFYRLGKVPTSLNADEVANGYNAYSILKTGKDEYNRKFPLLFQTFDDYRLPLNIYFTVPAIFVFGLSDFAVRFPSAVFGTLTVLLTYLLVIELLSGGLGGTNHFDIRNPLIKQWIALTSSFLLAISPWHLQFSRSAHEGTIAIFFTVLGVTCLLRAPKNKWLYIIGFISMALSVWSYHSSRVVTPLILISYTILYYRDILKDKFIFLSGMGLCFAICLPIIILSFSSTGLVRARGISALNDDTLLKRNTSWRQTDVDFNIPFSNVYHNHRFVNLSIMIKGYLDHYNPNFFFSELAQAKYRAPGVGLMYIWELPILLYGLYLNFRIKGRGNILLLLWFLFAPIAASITHMLPHPGRTMIFLPTLQIFTAIGLCGLCCYFYRIKHILGKLSIGISALVILIFCFHYLHQYYIHLPIDYAMDWQYGHEQVVEKVRLLQNKFDKVVISTTLDQPYIFFLYYLRYDPATYLRFGGTKSGKFDEERNTFDRYEFHSYMKSETVADPTTLYVGGPTEMLPGTTPLLEVLDPSGNIVYVLYGVITKLEWNKAGYLPYLE